MYDFCLVLHFIGLALGVGSGFASFTLGLSTRDMEPAERGKFMLRAAALSKNGSVGMLLLLGSGIGMVAMRGVHEAFIAGGTPFHLKLTFVALMLGLFGYIQVLGKRARAAGGGPAMAKLPTLSRLMLLLGLAVITTAVLAFH